MSALLLASAAMALAWPAAAAAQHDHSGHQMPPAEAPSGHEGHDMPAPDHAAPDHEAPDHAAMDHEAMGHEGHAMTGALGSYPVDREASGTAWQPDASAAAGGMHGGPSFTVAGFTFMGHALFNLVRDWQEGPRGDEKSFVSGMAMAMARRDFADGSALQLRAMLSPDPLMGKSGYPLHLAAGETADGENVLVDRQHPHDLFMELSASYSVRLSDEASLFLYGGLPGEPAFGPPAFMHRLSIMDSPEAPISHHWLDSTHITFGVVTAGLVLGDVKIEASRFRGREPDQHRYDIETGPLDSSAVRLSWNPTRHVSLQASWAHLKSPEQLEPQENQRRWSASGIYTRAIGENGWWSTTLAWGRRTSDHEDLDAYVLESALGLGRWTLFGRAERTETNELLAGEDGHHGPTFDVGKLSIGGLRDFRIGRHAEIGLGGLWSFNFVPAGLEPSYGGDPDGAMLFVRLKLG